MDASTLTAELGETLSVFEAGGEPRTTPEVAADLDLGRRTAYARLERLAETDRLATKKVGASARIWWRPPTAVDATATRALLDGVADCGDTGVLVVDADDRVTWANDAFRRSFGLEDADLVGRGAAALVEGPLAAAVEDAAAFGDAHADGTALECRVDPGADGEARWLEHTCRRIHEGALAGGRVHRYAPVTDRDADAPVDRRAEFESLVDAVEEYAIFTLDTDGHVRTWNPGSAAIKGYEASDILGEHFSTFYTDADREAGVPEANLAAARESGGVSAEGWRVRADGTRFWADVRITAIRDADGDLQGFAKVTRDMTASRRDEAERELLTDTINSLAGADSLESGLQAALGDICAVTEWEYAEAWVPTDEGDLRRAEADYHVDELADFAAFSGDYRFDPGEGLPGRVYASGTSEWAADLSDDSDGEFCRRDAALDADLRSSLGVPVVADGEVVAVLTFLMRDRRQRDERLVDLVSSVATELGTVVARRRAEQRLDRQHELLDRVFETAPTGLALFDTDRELLRANERLAETLGLSTEQTAGFSADDWQLYGPDGAPIPYDLQPVGRVLETGESVTEEEVRLERPDGSTAWLAMNAVPLTDADGALDQVVVSAQDITRLKERASRLERQRDDIEAELEEVLGRIDDGFFAIDDDWRITHVNDRAATLLERPAGELLGRNLWEAFPEAVDTAFKQKYERALADQESTTFEEYYPPLERWFEVTVYPSDTGLSVYFRDVTRRKARERDLEQYERIVETVGDGIYVLDEDGTFHHVNEAFVEMTQFSRARLLGSHASLVFGDDFEQLEATALRSIDRGEDDVAVFEEAVETATDETITVESRFRTFEVNGERRRAGVIRDITDRIERERDLELYATIVETVPDGVYALDEDDRFVLVNEAFCDLVEYDREELLGAHPTLVNSEALNRRANELAREVTAGDRTTATLELELQTASGESVPVEGHFSPYSHRDLAGRCGVARDISARVERERELTRQREQLTALNNLNRVLREITEAVIEQSTREEIERTVCELLADADSYLFAWVGDADATTQTVRLREEAGVEGYLDDVTISVDPDDEHSEGPTGRAFRTGDVQTTDHAQTAPRYEPWHDHASEYGYRSSAAIPIVHEDTVYGVLNVYSDRQNAFQAAEREMVSQLGEIVGHAIAAVDRKQALLSDEVVELAFHIDDVMASLGIDEAVEGRVELEHVVSVEDDEYVLFGRATPDATGVVEAMAEEVPFYDSVTFRDDGERFELTVTEPPVLSVIASLGGSVEEAVIEDGDYRLVVHLSPTADIGRAIETVMDAYPDATLLKRRQLSKRGTDGAASGDFLADLTDRQRTVLETAYYAGFFEWPRAAAGEAVADSLGVAPPTFHQHIRKAERQVFDRVFSSAD
ncbi:PAS domain S-box protein [Haloarcula onubensis]|uniref:PAS domain S-box protein n=1 Tax=Haloarcula onubensis TaxID=2950539 RepID=A0ABU2FTX4_9EURY|nr:PAS domain S-box protein [Halomicroarcula sp. S3CR25-11]MDS0283706.1 PAS domain S-box protein [Halomicroarcula sp. S3CR25-11]